MGLAVQQQEVASPASQLEEEEICSSLAVAVGSCPGVLVVRRRLQQQLQRDLVAQDRSRAREC